MTGISQLHTQTASSSLITILILLLLVTCSVYLVIGISSSKSTGMVPTQGAPKGETPEVGICQLLAEPDRYNHRVVTVTGFLSHGFEDSHLFDPACSSRLGIWYEYGGTKVTGTMYCCGLTAARTRPEQITVEGIPIPLMVDENFQRMDQLLHKPPSAIVRATVIGRFFSGEKIQAADGQDLWVGYGHMGMFSLLMIQQVVQVDPHDRAGLDYRAEPDYPNLSEGCGYQVLTKFGFYPSLITAQNNADANGPSWIFDDPKRVAVQTLAKLTNKDSTSIRNLSLTRQAQGRMVYEWIPRSRRAAFMVVVSRPYVLSFYAKTSRVAWVPIAAYRSSCGGR